MIHQSYAQRSQNTELIDTQPPKAVANAPKARLPQYRILLSARVSRAGEATTQQLRLTSSFYCTHTLNLTPALGPGRLTSGKRAETHTKVACIDACHFS